MRLPTRKSEKLKKYDDGPLYLTSDGLAKLKRQILNLEKLLPELVKEVTRTQEMGDLSENSAYQEAKFQMRRTQAKLFYLKESLKNVIEIQKDKNSNLIQLGSRFTISSIADQKSFELVGPSESNPREGRISHLSPIGSSVLGKKIGDFIFVNEIKYQITDVQ